MQEEKIHIKGMHCRSCKEILEMNLGSLAGVEKVSVDLAGNSARITYDSTQTTIEQIQEKIEQTGYSVEGDAGSAERSEGKSHDNGKGLVQGLLYGLIPHVGCIAFIIGSVLGVAVLMEFFRPLLMDRNFFNYLLGLAFVFATFSSALYLRNNGLLSIEGAKRKWKYLGAMYGSTIGINLLLFMFIFPLFANSPVAATSSSALELQCPVDGGPGCTTETLAGATEQQSGAQITGGSDPANFGTSQSAPVALYSKMKISVDIPCPGHAPLITYDLKTIDGVAGVEFSQPNVFDITYDPSKTGESEILSLEVFKTYPAKKAG
jgi:copper chaperone CopZ